MFQPNGTVTLTTDFGTQDGYVGAMKGIMLRVDAALRVVDIAHDVPPQDLGRAAATLASACPWFPAGTVHVVVVDPGVGTARAALVVQTRQQTFVGPDNGVLEPVLARLGSTEADVYRIADHAWLPAHRSATFHGRDVFAPTGAAVAAGLLRPSADLQPLGAPMQPLFGDAPSPRSVAGDGEALAARVTHVDRFGNAITSLPAADIAALGARVGPVEVLLPDGTRLALRMTYAEVEGGAALALISSADTLEVSVREGSAAAGFGLGPGDIVQVVRQEARS